MMRGLSTATLLGLVLLLTGCGGAPAVRPISIDEIGSVQGIIKQQVGIYIAATHPPVNRPATVVINGESKRVSTLEFYCGNGNIDFDIRSISVNLTTEIDRTRGVQFGVTVPVGSTTVGAQRSQSSEISNAQNLNYTLWPLPYEEQEADIRNQVPTDHDIAHAELARALLDLRNSLIVAATRFDYARADKPVKPLQACFSDYDPVQPGNTPGNTFTLSLNISKDRGHTLSVTVGAVTLGPNRDVKATSGQSITVTFVQRGASELQALRDATTTECKPGPANERLCSVAKLALRITRENGPIEVRDYHHLIATRDTLCHAAPAVPTNTAAHKGAHADKTAAHDAPPHETAECTRAQAIVATVDKLSLHLGERQNEASVSPGAVPRGR